MIDAIWEILLKIFTYFFALNAPMTIVMFLLTGGLFFYMKNRELSIVAPLEIAMHQHNVLKKQMDNSEGGIEEARAKFYGMYRHERRLGLERSGMTTDEARFNLDKDKDTHMHSLQLRGVHGALRNLIRDFFRENHLANKSESDFEAYIEKRKTQIWNTIVDYMNDYWFPDMSNPSRSDLFDVHEKNKDAILKIIDHIFRDGRKIAIEYQAKLDPKIRRKLGDF